MKKKKKNFFFLDSLLHSLENHKRKKKFFFFFYYETTLIHAIIFVKTIGKKRPWLNDRIKKKLCSKKKKYDHFLKKIEILKREIRSGMLVSLFLICETFISNQKEDAIIHFFFQL